MSLRSVRTVFLTLAWLVSLLLIGLGIRDHSLILSAIGGIIFIAAPIWFRQMRRIAETNGIQQALDRTEDTLDTILANLSENDARQDRPAPYPVRLDR